MADERANRAAFDIQASYCTAMAAPMAAQRVRSAARRGRRAVVAAGSDVTMVFPMPHQSTRGPC